MYEVIVQEPVKQNRRKAYLRLGTKHRVIAEELGMQLTIEIGLGLASVLCICDGNEYQRIARVTIPDLIIPSNEKLPDIKEACVALIDEAYEKA